MLPNKASYSTYGSELVDYSPVENPSTDLDASYDNEARVDTAQMTATAIRAWVRFGGNLDGYAVDYNGWDAVYGNSNATYIPIITGNNAQPGVFLVTFPASIVDSRGNTYQLNIRDAWCNYHSTTGGGYLFPNATVSSANSVTVYLWNPSGPSLANPLNINDRISLFVI